MGETISIDQAQDKLSSLRAGRGGGGESMYKPFLDEAEELKEGEVYTDTVDGYNRVSGLRNYLDDKRTDAFVVKSAKVKEDEDKSQDEARYRVFIYRSEDIEG